MYYLWIYNCDSSYVECSWLIAPNWASLRCCPLTWNKALHNSHDLTLMAPKTHLPQWLTMPPKILLLWKGSTCQSAESLRRCDVPSLIQNGNEISIAGNWDLPPVFGNMLKWLPSRLDNKLESSVLSDVLSLFSHNEQLAGTRQRFDGTGAEASDPCQLWTVPLVSSTLTAGQRWDQQILSQIALREGSEKCERK